MIMPAKKVLVVSGKRKTATARTIVRPGIGRIRINRTPIEIFDPKLYVKKSWNPSYKLEKMSGNKWTWTLKFQEEATWDKQKR